LYVLITSTDEQYNDLEAYYNRHPNQRAAAECYGLQTPTQNFPQAASTTNQTAPATPGEQSTTSTSKIVVCPPGYGSGQIPKWKEALAIIEDGDSIDCKLYQEESVATRAREAHDSTKGVPFRRWLYWRRPGGSWQPTAPDTNPETLGLYGGWELGVTSRACYDDFVILAQSATPATANESAQGAKVILNSQP
jgi:hypothetical protein